MKDSLGDREISTVHACLLALSIVIGVPLFGFTQTAWAQTQAGMTLECSLQRSCYKYNLASESFCERSKVGFKMNIDVKAMLFCYWKGNSCEKKNIKFIQNDQVWLFNDTNISAYVNRTDGSFRQTEKVQITIDEYRMHQDDYKCVATEFRSWPKEIF